MNKCPRLAANLTLYCAAQLNKRVYPKPCNLGYKWKGSVPGVLLCFRVVLKQFSVALRTTVFRQHV